MSPIRKVARFILRHGEFSPTARERKIATSLPRLCGNYKEIEMLQKMVTEHTKETYA